MGTEVRRAAQGDKLTGHCFSEADISHPHGRERLEISDKFEIHLITRIFQADIYVAVLDDQPPAPEL